MDAVFMLHPVKTASLSAPSLGEIKLHTRKERLMRKAKEKEASKKEAQGEKESSLLYSNKKKKYI